MTHPPGEEPPVLFRSWNCLYLGVLVLLLGIILALYALTRCFAEAAS